MHTNSKTVAAHYVGMNGGAHQKYDEMVYKRREAPVRFISKRGSHGWFCVSRQQSKYASDFAIWKDVMDGVAVSDAIATTCGPQFSILIKWKMDVSGDMHTRPVAWKKSWIQVSQKKSHLIFKKASLTTRTVLMPIRERLQNQMQTMRQGTDEKNAWYESVWIIIFECMFAILTPPMNVRKYVRPQASNFAIYYSRHPLHVIDIW